jgi:hypothetical protein
MKEPSRSAFVLCVLTVLILFAPGSASAGKGGCVACSDVAQERCTTNCFGLPGKAERASCLCSCDENVTLRSEDLVARMPWLVDSLTAACHSTTPCGSAYPSCASWSGYSNCDDPFCGFANHCGEECPEFGPCPGPAMRQRQERYRVCFNAQGQSCTEYQLTLLNLGCGC